jgi:iron complex transport system substrate-binding protein
VARSRREFLLAASTLALAPVALRAQATRTVIDDAGRRAEVPAKVARVYAAGPPASILVFALAPEKLLGWTSAFRPEERPFVPAKYADLPTLGRLTGRGNTANVEVVLAAKPDLIFDYGSVRPTFASLADRVQAQTGIPYLLFDGAFERNPQAWRRLGDVVGEPARGEEWARYAQGILDDVAARVVRIPPDRRPRVYYGRGPRGLDTGLAGSINMESIARIGATNVAAALGQGGLVQVSVEQVLAWNPDVIVTIDRNFYASIWRDPLWQGLAAVRSGKVFLSPNVPFGWIDFPPSLNRLVGLRWLGHTLYPDAFPEDLRPFVREFYTRAYHQTPTSEQLDALVRTAEPRRG